MANVSPRKGAIVLRIGDSCRIHSRHMCRSSDRQHWAYPRAVEAFDRIVRDPAVMTGRPCIRGTRVTVGAILGQLAAGHSVADVLVAYPYLTESDVQAALSYAAWRADEFEFPIPAA